MYVEDEWAAYVRYCFQDPMDAEVFRSRFEPRSERLQYLPEDRRDNPTWRHVAAQLEQAAAGVDVVDLGIALRLALMLEGLEYEAPQ
jgi:hypothetical protein